MFPNLNNRAKKRVTKKMKEPRQSQTGSLQSGTKASLAATCRCERLNDESAEEREARLRQMRDRLAMESPEE